MTLTPKRPVPLVIGEVLFDHFPDGQTVLGGAPLNVAWNLNGFGIPAVFLSAVGDDAQGNEVRRRMGDWAMETRGLQTNSHPTGRVSVTLVGGQPSYDIVQEVAFDFIDPPSFTVTPNEFSMLVLGSLAYRSEHSRSTIRKLIADSKLPRFVDINIRDPFFDPGWLDVLIGGARWLKLSDEELTRLTGSTSQSESEIQFACDQLRNRYDIETFFVTFGAKGAFAVEKGTITHAPTTSIDHLADTVGAGDAFAAATIAGLADGLPMRSILENAVRFASQVCRLTGATTTDRTFYRLDDLR